MTKKGKQGSYTTQRLREKGLMAINMAIPQELGDKLERLCPTLETDFKTKAAERIIGLVLNHSKAEEVIRQLMKEELQQKLKKA